MYVAAGSDGCVLWLGDSDGAGVMGAAIGIANQR